MRLVYDLGILLYGALLRLIAPFHSKAKRWVEGRKNLLRQIEQTIEVGQKHIWFHFASLGEFEQGRSVMEQIRAKYPEEKIIVTFFHHRAMKYVKTPLWQIMYSTCRRILLAMLSALYN